jgi:putative hydrolase of the HAD superfamily
MKDSLPKAILVDLDDTILATSDCVISCWQAVCEKYTFRVEGITPAELLAAVMESRASYLEDPERSRTSRLDLRRGRRDVAAAALSRVEIHAPGLADEMAEAYALAREEAIRPMPGAVDALRRLRAQGVLLALVTNGNAAGQRRKIVKFGLSPLFDCIVIEGELGAGKPDPQIFLHALRALDVSPEESWMIGDNLVADVGGAQRLGIHGVWVDHAGWGIPDEVAIVPDRIIRSLAELA